MHVGFYKHARIHIYTDCKHRLISSDSGRQIEHAHSAVHVCIQQIKHSYTSRWGGGVGVPLAQSVFIALINAPLASARSSPWPRWPASFYSHMVIKWRPKRSSSPHTCMKTSKAAKNKKDLTPLQLKLNFPFCTPFHFFLFCGILSWKNWHELVNLWAGIFSASGPLRLDTTQEPISDLWPCCRSLLPRIIPFQRPLKIKELLQKVTEAFGQQMDMFFMEKEVQRENSEISAWNQCLFLWHGCDMILNANVTLIYFSKCHNS